MEDFPFGHGRDAGVAASAETPLGKVLRIGGGDAQVRLGHQALAAAGGARIGSILKIATAKSWVYATVRDLIDGEEGVEVSVDLLGEAKTDGEIAFSRGVSCYPMPGDPVHAASDGDLAALLAPRHDVTMRVGKIYPTEIPAAIHADNLLSKHFAVLGSTGTGKSSAVALLIHRLVERLPHGHILIIDPHNEYAAAFSGIGMHFDPTTLSLPYWLMNLEEHIEVFIGPRTAAREVEVDILKRSLLAARKKGSRLGGGRITVDTPVPYKLSDLLAELDGQMGRLDKPEKHLPFLRLKHKIDELRNDERYGFMFSGLLISDSFSEILGRILRMPPDGKPVSTLDLSGVPSDIVDAVVSLLCRTVFDFALWSRKAGGSRPLLLVCEEAHRYVPRQEGARLDSARRVLERIAKEGRKYGVSLGLVSQRPSDLSESVLSQCGTIIAMRMNNERDRNFVASALPEGSQGFLESLASLQNRECIMCGEGVAAPLRVRLDDLETDRLPSSADPAFSYHWQSALTDPGYVKRVIERWRGGER